VNLIQHANHFTAIMHKVCLKHIRTANGCLYKFTFTLICAENMSSGY